jgi:hypothetical protein
MDTIASRTRTTDGTAVARTAWLIPSPRAIPPVAKSAPARLVSALCFASVCIALIGAGDLVAVFGGGSVAGVGVIVALLGLYGIPAALILGWIFAPRAGWAAGDEVAGLGAGVGALAVVIGDLTVACTFLGTAGASSTSPAVDLGPSLIGIFGLGLLFFGLPALLATVPASLAWIALFRSVVAAQPALGGASK